MITLYVNDTIIDIDDNTAVGVYVTTIDPYNPTTIKKTSTNNFSIPKTFNNLRIFGYANNPTYTNVGAKYIDRSYERMEFKYYYHNELVFKGLCYLDKINDRIHIVGYEFPDVFDWMRSISYNDFLNSYLNDFLKPKYNVPIKGDSNVFLTEFQRYLSTGTTKCDALQFIGSFQNEDGDFYKDYTRFGMGRVRGFSFTFNRVGSPFDEEGIKVITGNHYSSRFKYIIEYIKQQYNADTNNIGTIDFEVGTAGCFIDSDLEQTAYLTLRGLSPAGSNTDAMYFYASVFFVPESGYPDKTLYDIFALFIKQFNLVVDSSVVGDETTYAIRCFSDIESANIYDFNRNIDLSDYDFEPKFAGLAQQNIVKYEFLPAEMSPQYKGAILRSSNMNLPYKSDMASIPVFCGEEFLIDGDTETLKISNNKSDKAKTNFIIMKRQSQNYLDLSGKNFNYRISGYNGGEFFTVLGAEPPSLGVPFDLSEIFSFMNTFFDKPKKYKIKKFFSVQEIRDLKKWQLYYIKELGGSFVISEISGFNPRSSKATDVTVIKISDLTSDIYEEFDYFVIDGEFLTIGGEKLY